LPDGPPAVTFKDTSSNGASMRIDVIGKQMDVTEAIRQYADQKAAKLVKHYDGVQQITLRLEADPRKKGFRAEVIADVEHHDDFVAETHHEDLYAAIDEATDKVARQLTGFKEKLKQNKRGGPSGSGA